MTKNIKFEFETNTKFKIYLFFAVFIPFYYDADINIVFKLLIYFIPPYILTKFVDNNKMIIYDNTISYYKYSRSFERKFEIDFSDIEKVYVTRIEMSYKISPSLTIYSKSLKRKFRVQIYREIDQSLCEHFIDNKITVETNNNSLRNHISHYLLGHRPKNT